MANNFRAWVPFRVWLLALAAAAALVALVAALVVENAPAGAATDREPDLGMAHPRALQIDTTSAPGRKLLRFNSIVVNVGAGPFELRGTGNTGASEMSTVEQRVFDDAGGSRYDPTPATMVFGGDGHNHWHVTNLQDFELRRLDNGVKVGTGAKMGFCFFDGRNHGSGEPAFYLADTTTAPPSGACGGGTSATETTMGLSPGWGDIYGWRLPDQYIDITGLTNGRYQLRVTADADDWFFESNNGNNFSWINIQIRTNAVSIVRYGPAAAPV
jgi:hypothetical protein